MCVILNKSIFFLLFHIVYLFVDSQITSVFFLSRSSSCYCIIIVGHVAESVISLEPVTVLFLMKLDTCWYVARRVAYNAIDTCGHVARRVACNAIDTCGHVARRVACNALDTCGHVARRVACNALDTYGHVARRVACNAIDTCGHVARRVAFNPPESGSRQRACCSVL